MNNKTAAAIILSMSLLGGCASLEDFQKMSPNERALKVCHSNDHIQTLSYQKRRDENELDDIQTRLNRGYEIIKRCSERKISTGEVDKKGNEIIKRSEHCSEQVIPFNNYIVSKMIERANILENRIALKSSEYQIEWNRCMEANRGIDAKTAYEKYKNIK